MIKEVDIKNYQSHKRTFLKLSPKINVFIGESDQGKSALYRAIKMAFFNQSGSNFIHFNEKNCYVEVKLDDCIIKIDKPENQITLDNDIYSSIGRSVPEAVKNKTRIKEIDFVDDIRKIINFQDQHDYKFMVDDEIENSRILGAISGYNGVLNAIKYTNKEKKNLTSTRKIILNTIESKETEIIKYDGIEIKKENILNVNEQINKIEELNKKIENIVLLKNKSENNVKETNSNSLLLNKYLRICNYNNDTMYINNKYNFFNKVIDLKNKLVNIHNSILTLSNKIKNINNIIEYCDEVNDITNIFDKFKNIKKQKNKIDIIKNESKNLKEKLNQFNFLIDNKSNIDEIIKRYSLYLCIKEKNLYLQKIVDEAKVRRAEMKDNDNKISILINEYNNFIDNLDICKTCKRPFTEADKDKLKKHE